MKRLLFICSENRFLGPTAEAVFSKFAGVEALSASLHSHTPTPLDNHHIEWADLIFVMEESHKNRISKRYAKLLADKKIVVLDIPRVYDFMQPELVELLKAKVLGNIQISSMRGKSSGA